MFVTAESKKVFLTYVIKINRRHKKNFFGFFEENRLKIRKLYIFIYTFVDDEKQKKPINCMKIKKFYIILINKRFLARF